MSSWFRGSFFYPKWKFEDDHLYVGRNHKYHIDQIRNLPFPKCPDDSSAYEFVQVFVFENLEDAEPDPIYVKPMKDHILTYNSRQYEEVKNTIENIRMRAKNLQIGTKGRVSPEPLVGDFDASRDASVVGRAVVGGIVAGPAGAVVGALSAVDKNNRNK